MPDLPDSRQNHLLAALPAAEYKRLSPHLELVQMRLGHVLYESGVNCVTSIPHDLHHLAALRHGGWRISRNRRGRQRGCGALCTGGETMPNLSVVRCTSYAYRHKSKLLKEAFNRGGGRRSCALQDLLLRYTQALITQISQIAVCNRHHSVE